MIPLKNISVNFYKCDDLIAQFGEKKLADRYDNLLNEMEGFIVMNGLQDKAVVNRMLLAEAVRDYFYDILRLKNFHSDIERTCSEKVIGYSSYWLLYRKPIQITEIPSTNKDLVTLNERFVLQYILNYLSVRERGKHILLRENLGLKNFSEFMLYYLAYRKHDAQSLEMIITAFLAGQIYENIDEDITEQLHPYDK